MSLYSAHIVKTSDVTDYSDMAADALRHFRSRVLLIDRSDMCLCGLLSLPRSVQLICAIEVFFSVVFLMQSPDLLKMDGTYFYFLGLLDGQGVWFFSVHLAGLASSFAHATTSVGISCVLTSALLPLGIRFHKPVLLLPHLFWQVFFICFCICIIATMITLTIQGKMLTPSCVVLSILLFIPGIFEVWWTFLTYQLFKQMFVFGATFKEQEADAQSEDFQMYSTEI